MAVVLLDVLVLEELALGMVVVLVEDEVLAIKLVRRSGNGLQNDLLGVAAV